MPHQILTDLPSLLTETARALDAAWPAELDRLAWREALAAIEREALGLRREAAGDALSLLEASRSAGVLLSPSEAAALAAALVATPPDGETDLR